MRIDCKYGNFSLVEYHNEDDSAEDFAEWFEFTFQFPLSYKVSEDKFVADFYYGINFHKKYSGILHMNCTPIIKKPGYYQTLCDKVIKKGIDDNRFILFGWLDRCRS